MDELYRIHEIFSCPNHGGGGGLGSSSSSDMSDLLKAQIANHPLYPNLVSAYVECKKIGAPPEMASLLEEICKERRQNFNPRDIGADPELDRFMESYCNALHGYKDELLKPFDEATAFLSNIESQLDNLCHETIVSTTTASPMTSATCHSVVEANGGRSEDDISCGEVEVAESQESSSVGQGENHHLKEMLMRKYSGYLSTLRKEFLKKRKKGKLPKDATTALLDWWNTHYRWPYPTEEEKTKLSEVTGLDQKQINNWFINQRKRHWKPSEDMRFALMHGIPGPTYFDSAAGGGNPSFGN